MPTITIRVSAAEKAKIEAAAHAIGESVSEYVREALAIRNDVDYAGRMDDFERRLARLEEIAEIH